MEEALLATAVGRMQVTDRSAVPPWEKVTVNFGSSKDHSAGGLIDAG